MDGTQNIDIIQVWSAMQDLQQQVRTMQTELLDLPSLTARIHELERENQNLRFLQEENLQLKAQLAALSGAHPDVTSGTNPEPAPTATPAATPKPTWAKVVQKAPRQLSPRKQAANARPFQPVEGPQGFEYIYITRSRRINRPEIRQRLRRLGIDTARVLDISLPTKSTVGLLLHVQYTNEVKACLEKAKIPTIPDFEPLDPIHLADPASANLPAAQRADLALQIHRNRCLRSLSFLRPLVARAVARYFQDLGWIDETDIPRKEYVDRDAPTNTPSDDDSLQMSL